MKLKSISKDKWIYIRAMWDLIFEEEKKNIEYFITNYSHIFEDIKADISDFIFDYIMHKTLKELDLYEITV